MDNIISEHWPNPGPLNDNYCASPGSTVLAQFNATKRLPKTLPVWRFRRNDITTLAFYARHVNWQFNGDPFHATTSFLDFSGDSIALLTTMSFHERFFFQHISGVPRFHVRLNDV